MASSVMKNGKVNACFVGCDRVAANGDTANKIGTSGLAIIAKHYGIPFYVCAPASTIDMTIKDGGDIVIEERDAQEVTDMWYKERMAPSGIKVYNPAFDVTDNSLITAFVTEFGIVRPPYIENFKAMFKSEGYVKYTAEHTMSPAIETPHFEELNRARTKLRELGLVGAALNGIGFGNLSLRVEENEFLISGTATGSSPVLGPDGYCLITSFDVSKNRVESTGPVKPSSETMTHGVIYQSCPNANCVIHIHSRTIFDGMIRDKYPATPVTAAYGTPEIALAIGKLVRHDPGKNEGSIVLAGHDEGVIVYAATIEKALSLTEELYNKYQLTINR
jgi:ribulose-5-phosphate 4-epimerase/fuculose-1-phosphate aldolase